ncbi:MAG: DUF2441 domain-containing protein [Bacteroidetes bacterium]|nr:MAG: DUF2441 domain-containing protein [Bacteroidota bacterium]
MIEKYFHIDREDKINLAINDTLICGNKINVSNEINIKKLIEYFNEANNACLAKGCENFKEGVFSIDLHNYFKELLIENNIEKSDSGNIWRKTAVEFFYEKTRIEINRDLCSRLKCFYLTKNPNEWITFFQSKGSYNLVLYEFETIKGKLNFFDSNFGSCSINAVSFDEIVKQSNMYWKSKKTENYLEEILFEGELIITNKTQI